MRVVLIQIITCNTDFLRIEILTGFKYLLNRRNFK